MKLTLIICFFLTFSGFSQNSQADFDFLIGKERTDSSVYNYLTQQFSLFDDEYEQMWELEDEGSDDWSFFKSDPDPKSWLYEFPLFVVVKSGKITSIEVIAPRAMTAEANERWIEFYSSDLPGGFRFDLSEKEMKKMYDKQLSKKRKLIGFTTKVSKHLTLTIMGRGTKKSPVRQLVYK